MAISMLKIRRPLGRLIFNMGIAIPGKTVFLIETAPYKPIQMQQVLTFLGNILNLLKYPCVIKVSSYLWVYSSVYGHRDDYQSHSITEKERHHSPGDDC